MPIRRNRIKEVIKLMQDGLEQPVTKVLKGKKHTVLSGEFVTIEADAAGAYDEAFIVNGDEGDRYAYMVEIVAVDTWSDEFNKIGKSLMSKPSAV